MTTDLVWYAAYGSNLSRDRLMYYLAGGQPVGAARSYPGARDRSEPRDERTVELPGEVYFAWESSTWGGGVAFYDAVGSGPSIGRAYLVTAAQFADIAAQEMHRPIGLDLDLTAFKEGASAISLGPGRYETLQLICRSDDQPVITFSSETRHRHYNAPVGRYLQLMARGIAQSHHWSLDQIVEYLLTRPGTDLAWNVETLRSAIDGAQR